MSKKYIQEVEDLIICTTRDLSNSLKIMLLQEKLNCAKYALFLKTSENGDIRVLDFFNTLDGGILELSRLKKEVWVEDKYTHKKSFNRLFEFEDYYWVYKAWIGSIYE